MTTAPLNAVKNAMVDIREAATWPTDDDNVFARLRIWVSRFDTLVPNEDFTEFFDKVSREAFWKVRHQRDLLLTLQERWARLPMPATRRIEERILEGRERWENEAEHDFVQRRAWQIAERLHWLQEVVLNFRPVCRRAKL